MNKFIKENIAWWEKHLHTCQNLAAACIRRVDEAATDTYKLHWLELAQQYQAQAQKCIEQLDKLKVALG